MMAAVRAKQGMVNDAIEVSSYEFRVNLFSQHDPLSVLGEGIGYPNEGPGPRSRQSRGLSL